MPTYNKPTETERLSARRSAIKFWMGILVVLAMAVMYWLGLVK